MTSALTSENDLLNLLRARYEAEGYTFIAHPGREILPPFLGPNDLDAVAIKGDEKIAIEIRSASRKKNSPDRLAKLSEIFSSRPDWKFRVIQARDLDRPDRTPPIPSTSQITRALNNASKLSELGQQDAAFVIAWGAFEAAARAIDDLPILPPKSIVESLERNGRITAAMGKQLRTLTTVRNAIVHGNYQRRATKTQTEMIIILSRILAGQRKSKPTKKLK